MIGVVAFFASLTISIVRANNTESAVTSHGFSQHKTVGPIQDGKAYVFKIKGVEEGNRFLCYHTKQLVGFHWSSAPARYFRLLFAMESVSPGIVEKHYQSGKFKLYVSRLRERVQGLRRGLNITSDGKLKTYEEWLITFHLVNDLITKMKKSAAGREIINGQLLDDWEKIKLHSDTAKFRHLGMVKIGLWKSTPSIKGIGYEQLWESVL